MRSTAMTHTFRGVSLGLTNGTQLILGVINVLCLIRLVIQLGLRVRTR